MGNKITEEIDNANKYLFEKVHDDLVKISVENVAIAEAMIKNDSGYYKAYDTKNKKSSAYWFDKLKNCNGEEYGNIIQNIVDVIDRENGTHLNADGCGRGEIATRLKEYGKEKLINDLKVPDYSDLKVFNRLCEKTKPNNERKKGRCNKSFASKFCHYACYFLFEGEEEQDNFPIYDSVVKGAIPKYLEYFDIDEDGFKDLENYSVYINAIDKIIKASGENVSRNGLDHLLWYVHRGRK